LFLNSISSCFHTKWWLVMKRGKDDHKAITSKKPLKYKYEYIMITK
jgi:hypothetical protein